MDRRDSDLAALFAVGLSFASAACSASTEATDGAATPEATAPASSTSAEAAPTSSAVATATPTTTSTAAPPPHDDTTPTGYAAAFQSIGPYTHALSGLELLGFVDVVDGKLQCDGKPCPAEWNTLADGTFTRAAVVKKSRTLAVITPANFAQWVGPIDTPEKAALRAQLGPGRKLATCATFGEQGLACAVGSSPTAVAVRVVEGGFEVATYDERNVCRGHGRGSAVTIGAERVTREGDTQEATNTMTVWAYENARKTTQCYYPRKGRAYDGWHDPRPNRELDRTARDYHARSRAEEAASAIAFDRLAAELERHGAPADIVLDARRAADDERRHAALFEGLLGPLVDELSDAPPFEARSLEALLLENAVEGCANETYSAVVATHQAASAPTEALRSLFRAIAADEQRHAELSHRIHRWGVTRVDARGARAVEAALDEAVSRMVEVGDATPGGLELGEPAPRVARAAFAWVVAAMRRGGAEDVS